MSWAHIPEVLTWSFNTSHLVKRVQQRLLFLRNLKKACLASPLTEFTVTPWSSTTETMLSYYASVWKENIIDATREVYTKW